MATNYILKEQYFYSLFIKKSRTNAENEWANKEGKIEKGKRKKSEMAKELTSRKGTYVQQQL